MNKTQQQEVIKGLTILIEDELKKYESYVKKHRPSNKDFQDSNVDNLNETIRLAERLKFFPKNKLKEFSDRYHKLERFYELKGTNYLSNF